MRISDWSSDVCSSDLSLSAYSARHVPHRTKVRRNAFLLYRNASGRSSGTRIASNSVQSKREPVDLIGVGTIERSTLAFAGRAVTLEIAPMGSSSHALPQLHDAALHTPTHRSPRTDISLPLSRSEEHTSELQSLMRISYAVFCLKK